MDSLLNRFVDGWRKDIFVYQHYNNLWIQRLVRSKIERRVIVTYLNEIYPPFLRRTRWEEDVTPISEECMNNKDLIVMYDIHKFGEGGMMKYKKYKVYDINNPSFDPEKIIPEINDFLIKEE
jgi:hypothetical protein